MGRLFWKVFLAFWLALLVAGFGTGLAVRWYLEATGDSMPPPGLDGRLVVGPFAESALATAAALLRAGGMPALASLTSDGHVRGRGIGRVLAVDEAGRDVLGRPVPAASLAQARDRLRAADAAIGALRVRTPDGQRLILFVPPGRDGARSDRDRLLTPGPQLDAPHARPGPPGDGMRGAMRRDPGLRLSRQATNVIWVGVGVLVSLVFAAALAWYLARPIRHLRGAFEALASGRLDARVSAAIGARRDEIADLGHDFDAMAARLQASIAAQRRLLHDVSHELRSPLARLQAAIGLARQDAGEREAMLERIERESQRLDALVGEVLTLARLEAGNDPGALTRESVALTDLVAPIAEDADFEARAAGLRVTLAVAAEPKVRADAQLLHRAIENVVRNAVRHSPAGSTVEIEVGEADAGADAIVRVADRGPGVAEDELEAIFEPFRRGAAARGEGFGLGLAIARRAVVSHGGTIRARRREGGGLVVEIRLARDGGVVAAGDRAPA